MHRRLQLLAILEAGLMGLFFVQSIRFLIGMIYSRIAGASAVTALTMSGITIDAPIRIPDPALVNSEVTFLIYMLALPLITLLFGRVRPFIIVSVLLVALGRLFMATGSVLTPLAASALVVGGTFVYILMLARWRMSTLPYLFIIGFTADQLLRAFGNSADPSRLPDYLNIQIILSAAVVIISLLQFVLNRQREGDEVENRGLLPITGAFGLAGLLYLELSLLALPNAIAGRADTNHTTMVTPLVVATLLPIIPTVRSQARAFISLFDANVRGWLWMLLIAILIVLGTRLNGVIAGAALIGAQFLVSLTWFWITRPRADKERSLGPIWVLFGLVLFGLLIVGDNFTYEYAFVRSFSGDAAFLNQVIPPLLRGFRGFGLGLLLLAVFLAVLPMTQMQRRVAWSGKTGLSSLLLLLIVIGAGVGAAILSRPPVVQGVRGSEVLRVGTYNIHGGFDEFYNDSLEDIARTIQGSGVNVVLLQEVDAGRLTSFGIDQSLWLARRLGMDRRFYATNEGLQGLAVLSNVEIAFDDGSLLDSLGNQTGVQRVQVLPNPNTVVTLYNTWLSPLFDLGDTQLTEQEQDQERQLNQLFGTYIQQACSINVGRTLIGGTFHNVPDSPLVQGLRNAGFSDPFAGAALELSSTFVRTGLPRARFDYLWTCNLPSSGTGVMMNSYASDHRLAFSEVILNRAPGS
ncbi:MAG: hypothetical protein IPK17_24165 [Chloroflexi bacterium]|uniref:endonuclease/exonuclease/phosphatase family protein n=1 Tax=Candidatus Flexifilum breve TaxID=3140694 RepID=UPI0031370699|nr:hypothetical protein [Chloroflexota bacterium]